MYLVMVILRQTALGKLHINYHRLLIELIELRYFAPLHRSNKYIAI